LFLVPACNEDDFCCIDPENEIVDTWLLFERGYSPGAGYYDVDNLEHSYWIEFQENGTVRLYFRWCIEGCHLGLRRLSN